MTEITALIERLKMAERDGSEVKSTVALGHRFGSQHICSASQLSVTPVPVGGCHLLVPEGTAYEECANV